MDRLSTKQTRSLIHRTIFSQTGQPIEPDMERLASSSFPKPVESTTLQLQLFTELHCRESWDVNVSAFPNDNAAPSVDIEPTTFRLLFGDLTR